MEEPIQHNIKCPIFLETNAVIKNIISKFYKAGPKERQDYVQDILIELKALLSCTKYNPVNSDCLDCHYILRKYLQEYKPNSFLLSNSSSQQER